MIQLHNDLTTVISVCAAVVAGGLAPVAVCALQLLVTGSSAAVPTRSVVYGTDSRAVSVRPIVARCYKVSVQGRWRLAVGLMPSDSAAARRSAARRRRHWSTRGTVPSARSTDAPTATSARSPSPTAALHASSRSTTSDHARVSSRN